MIKNPKVFFYSLIFVLLAGIFGCSNSGQPTHRMQAKITLLESTEEIVIKGIDRILKANGFERISPVSIDNSTLVYIDIQTSQQNFHIWKDNDLLIVDALSIPSAMPQSSTVDAAFIGVAGLAKRFKLEISTTYDETKMIPRGKQ